MKRGNIHIRLWMMVMAVGLLLLASCGTKRSVLTRDLGGLSDGAYLREVMSRTVGADVLSAKMKLVVDMGGEELSVGGSIKMKRDEAIQLSLVAVGIVEAARIEMTPERILVLDRMNRRYVEMPYAGLTSSGESGMDFYTLQALFWNELFLPGVRQVGSEDAGNFARTRDEGCMTLSAKGPDGWDCTFLTALSDGRLLESRIARTVGPDYRMTWRYGEFEPVAGGEYPTHMTLEVQGGKLPMQADFHFTRLTTDTEVSPLAIPKKYQRMEADNVWMWGLKVPASY